MEGKCICDRPLANVICRNCGLRLKNTRVRKICPCHPMTHYIQDLTQCPGCRKSIDILHEYVPSPKKSAGSSKPRQVVVKMASKME